MRVCITGATGLIGTSLLARLSSREDVEIAALARSIPPQPPLAHANSPLTSDQDIASDALLNLVPTLHLLAAIQDAGTKPHLIYADSGGTICGASDTNRKFKESDACALNSSYHVHKLATENPDSAQFLPGWCVPDIEKARDGLGGTHKIRLAAELGMLLGGNTPPQPRRRPTT